MRTYHSCKSCRQLKEKLNGENERNFRWKIRLIIHSLSVIAHLLSFLTLLLTCSS